MNHGSALARLEAMTAAQSAPVLSVTELELLLESARIVDATGLAPTAAGYTPTWDLNRATAEGWRWKAAKAAGSFDFTADGASYNRSQVLDLCQKMATQYARKIIDSVPLAPPPTEQTELEDD